MDYLLLEPDEPSDLELELEPELLLDSFPLDERCVGAARSVSMRVGGVEYVFLFEDEPLLSADGFVRGVVLLLFVELFIAGCSLLL